MASFKLSGAALILLTAFATPAFAQMAGLPELPGDYAFFRANDDFSPAFQPIQPPSVVELRVPTRPHRVHHISSTRAH